MKIRRKNSVTFRFEKGRALKLGDRDEENVKISQIEPVAGQICCTSAYPHFEF